MKILAVDDDPIILELLKQFMAAFGDHVLVTAESGQEALDKVSQDPGNMFDCFLFDIQMPSMDGVELTQRIREMDQYIDTPVLMLTAMSDKRYVDAAFAAGTTDYITKPFEITELRRRLEMVEGLVKTHQSRTRKVFATHDLEKTTSAENPADVIELFEPVSIYDVDNVIEYLAFENYVAQLSRSALFGSTTFAFTIRKIEEFHADLSTFEFNSLITDVADMISETLGDRHFLMSYAGSGTFVCVTESGWRPDTRQLMDAVNLSLATTELYDNAGQRLHPRVSAGAAMRLIWKQGNSIMEAIAAAHMSAEDACAAHARDMNDFWLVEKRA